VCPLQDAVSSGKAVQVSVVSWRSNRAPRVHGRVVYGLFTEDHGLYANKHLQDGGYAWLPLFAFGSAFEGTEKREAYCVTKLDVG
jgi:hypothetical protein